MDEELDVRCDWVVEEPAERKDGEPLAVPPVGLISKLSGLALAQLLLAAKKSEYQESTL